MNDRTEHIPSGGEPLPESSRIALDGSAGCVALYQVQLSLSQDGESVVLSYLDFSRPPGQYAVQQAIPVAEFRALWRSICFRPQRAMPTVTGISTSPI